MRIILILTLFLTSCSSLGQESKWECFDDYKGPAICRFNVKDGWLVWAHNHAQGGLTFYPDKNHEWKY